MAKKYPLIELGQVIRSNPKTVVINMTAFPQAIPSVLKALSESGMNLNPQQDGTTLYVPVPKVTKEHREALAKNAKTHFIKCRDGIRDVQTGCARSLKNKEKAGLSSDLSHQVQEQVKSIADTYIAQAEKMLTTKQAELLNA
uniref:Ribosome-recycling factor, mitochondrial n=1 Tax=Lygus hesperus TaxID=30085 RepID=A0A0K8SAS9_LYGHE